MTAIVPIVTIAILIFGINFAKRNKKYEGELNFEEIIQNTSYDKQVIDISKRYIGFLRGDNEMPSNKELVFIYNYLSMYIKQNRKNMTDVELAYSKLLKDLIDLDIEGEYDYEEVEDIPHKSNKSNKRIKSVKDNLIEVNFK